MPKSNLEFIKSLYDAYARGDKSTVIAGMSDDIVWNEAENLPYSDRSPYKGPAAVEEGIFSRLMTEWDSYKVNPAEFIDAGDTIVVLGRYNAKYKATGSVFDAQFAHIWRLKDGKIAAFQQYTDTAQAARVVGTAAAPRAMAA